MNPKLFVTLAILVTLFCSSTPKDNCADAYTAASYGLSHSKKAFKAHNFDHQKYYAGRALEALEKTRDLVGECGCMGAMNSIEDGIEYLEEALDPTDWKMGRYYSKKAMENNYVILEKLDICSMEGDSTTDSAGTEDKAESVNSSGNEIDNGETEEALIAFKESAQVQMEELNKKIKELGLMLGCENSQLALDQTHLKLPEAGEFSSLEEAMDYYKQQTIMAYQQAAAVLQECGKKQ